ncbi:MAG: hypothetical protein ACTHKD_06085 [Devosia sp.]
MTQVHIRNLCSTAVLGGEAHFPELVIKLDDTGVVTIRALSSPTGSWRFTPDVDRGAALIWTSSGQPESRVVIDMTSLSALIDELTPLLQQVWDSYSLYGSYKDLDDDDQGAANEVQGLLDAAEWSTSEGVVDALDWLEYRAWTDVSISLDTTDDEIASMVPGIQRLGEEDELSLYGIDRALRYRRSQLKEPESFED